MRKRSLFIKKLEELYDKRFPPTFERPNPFSGEMEVMPSGVTNASNVSALFCSEMLSIIVEAKKEFPKIVNSNHCVESVDNKLRFVDFVSDWFAKWFGVDLTDEEERRL